MVDIMNLRQSDSDFQTQAKILDLLKAEGYIDQMRAQLRAQVVKKLEQEKKKSYGGASKYLQQSEISNAITKKVISQEDGLLCAEVIREFFNFYKMDFSL